MASSIEVCGWGTHGQFVVLALSGFSGNPFVEMVLLRGFWCDSDPRFPHTHHLQELTMIPFGGSPPSSPFSPPSWSYPGRFSGGTFSCLLYLLFEMCRSLRHPSHVLGAGNMSQTYLVPSSTAVLWPPELQSPLRSPSGDQVNVSTFDDLLPLSLVYPLISVLHMYPNSDLAISTHSVPFILPWMPLPGGAVEPCG